MGGHSRITKCFRTINQRFYCSNLAEHLCAYITECHKCQLLNKGRNLDRPYQKRINLNAPSMTKISMDIKEMLPSHAIHISLFYFMKFLISLLPFHFTQLGHSTLLKFFREVI